MLIGYWFRLSRGYYKWLNVKNECSSPSGTLHIKKPVSWNTKPGFLQSWSVLSFLQSLLICAGSIKIKRNDKLIVNGFHSPFLLMFLLVFEIHNVWDWKMRLEEANFNNFLVIHEQCWLLNCKKLSEQYSTDHDLMISLKMEISIQHLQRKLNWN